MALFCRMALAPLSRLRRSLDMIRGAAMMAHRAIWVRDWSRLRPKFPMISWEERDQSVKHLFVRWLIISLVLVVFRAPSWWLHNILGYFSCWINWICTQDTKTAKVLKSQDCCFWPCRGRSTSRAPLLAESCPDCWRTSPRSSGRCPTSPECRSSSSKDDRSPPTECSSPAGHKWQKRKPFKSQQFIFVLCRWHDGLVLALIYLSIHLFNSLNVSDGFFNSFHSVNDKTHICIYFIREPQQV